MRSAARTDPRRLLAAALIAAGLAGLVGLAAAPAHADGFPARSLGKPFFLADILTFPAGAGSLDVEVAWEIPVGELTFREEHGYYRARYDISVVCRRGGRQIGGDVWERRVRLDTFAETRSSSDLARGRQRFRIPTGDFEARVEVRDRQTDIASQVKGKVDGDPADLRIGLGDLRLVRYTGEGAQPNPDGKIRIGEPGHRARVKVRMSEGDQGVAVLVWRIIGPDGPAAKREETVEVRGREADVELPLDTTGFLPGRHRLEVGVKEGPGDPRTHELWLQLTAAWFVGHREETLEILGIVAPGELEGMRQGEGEAEWTRALERFWQARDPDPSTPASEYRLDLQARIEATSRFVEPFRHPGWRTDRGKVLLENGEPPRRSVRPGSEDAPPSELWEYDAPRRQFLFVDLRGTGGVLAGSLIAVGVLAGCADSPEADRGTLRIAWSADPVTLDPARTVDVVGASAVALVYEGLVTFERDGGLGPGIARSWSVSEDGLVWTFELDPEARDSRGRSVGAAEVAASFHRLLDPATASPRTWVLERIAGADAFRRGEADAIEGLHPGDGTVRIELEAPTASFLAMLAMPNAAILPAGVVPDGTVATGPWVLEEHVRDSHLRFRRNPDWHGAPVEMERLRVRILPEEFTRVAEWETDRLDLLEIPASQGDRFASDPRRMRQVSLVTEYVGLNNADPVLRDPRVRRALNHAVDVDLMLEHVLGGRGVRSAGAIPPTLPGGDRGQPFRHDPELARELLAEAEVPADWELELWQRPSPLASQVLEAIQTDLAAVGVRSSIRLRDWSALKASIDQGETPAFFINWYADYPDAENFLVPLFHSRNVGGGGNRSGFRDPEVDAGLERLERGGDPSSRAELAADLDARVHAQAPWIYLWHPVLEILVSDRIEGYRPHVIPSAERWLGVRPAAGANAP